MYLQLALIKLSVHRLTWTMWKDNSAKPVNIFSPEPCNQVYSKLKQNKMKITYNTACLKDHAILNLFHLLDLAQTQLFCEKLSWFGSEVAALKSKLRVKQRSICEVNTVTISNFWYKNAYNTVDIGTESCCKECS